MSTRSYCPAGACTRCHGAGRIACAVSLRGPATYRRINVAQWLAPEANHWLNLPCSPCSGTGARAEQLAYEQAMADVQAQLAALEGPPPAQTPGVPPPDPTSAPAGDERLLLEWEALPQPVPQPSPLWRVAEALCGLLGRMLGRLL